jgi:hypothetical protein
MAWKEGQRRVDFLARAKEAEEQAEKSTDESNKASWQGIALAIATKPHFS